MSKQKSKTYVPAGTKQKTAAQTKQPERAADQAWLNYRKKRFWTIGIISLVTAIVLTLSIVFAVIQPPVPEEISNDAPKTVTDNASIKNGSFDYVRSQGLSMQYPLTPKDWTINKENDRNSLIGVLDTDEDEWDRVKSNLANQDVNIDSTLENKILNRPEVDLSELGSQYDDDYEDSQRLAMVYNHTAATANMYSASFSASSGKYYAISVWILTSGLDKDLGDEGAFIWLTTTTATGTAPEARFEGIQADTWTQYTFYVEASKSTSTSLYIAFGLGRTPSSIDPTRSKGVAFFDYAVSMTSTKGDYIAAVNDTDTTVATKSFDDTNNTKQPVPVALDQANSNGQMTLTAEQFATQHSDQGKLPFPSSAEIHYINNTVNPTNGLNVKFDSVTVALPALNTNYRLSFWVKTSNLPQGTGAYAYLSDQSRHGIIDKSTYLGPIASEEDPEDNTFNGWTEYIFFISPSNSYDYQLQLQIYLGMKNNLGAPIASGKLFVTEVEWTKIEPHEYSNATTSSTSAKLDLETTATGGTIANGSFNTGAGNVNSTYPIAPAHWDAFYAGMSLVGGDGVNIAPNNSSETFYGIMNKDQTAANAEFGLTADDFPTFGGQNIVMLHSTVDTAMGLRSTSFTLAADSFYHISVLVKVKDGAKANMYLISQPNTADELDVNGIDLSLTTAASGTYYSVGVEEGYGEYKRFNFFVTTGFYSKTVNLELWLGQRDATAQNGGYSKGTVLFDQASSILMEKTEFRTHVGSEDDVALVRTEQRDEDNNLTEVNLELKDSSTINVAGIDMSAMDVEPEQDEDEDDEEDNTDSGLTEDIPREPFDWLQLPMLILALALLFTIATMIGKRFKLWGRRNVSGEEPEYKRK